MIYKFYEKLTCDMDMITFVTSKAKEKKTSFKSNPTQDADVVDGSLNHLLRGVVQCAGGFI